MVLPKIDSPEAKVFLVVALTTVIVNLLYDYVTTLQQVA